MNIIVNIDLIEQYLSNLVPKTKTDIQKKVDNLFCNHLNKVILSKNFVELSERYFETKDSNLYEYFKLMVKDWYSNERYIPLECGKNSDVNDEFRYLISKEKENIAFAFKYSTDKELKIKGKKVVSITNCRRHNYEWLYLTLAANHYVKLRYYDFPDNNSVSDFFELLFGIPKSISEVYIFDRQSNVNHRLYKAIEKKKIKVKYFKYNVQLQDIQLIKQYFGKPYEVWNTHKLDLIHERNILFNNLIIETNEDPNNIDPNRETWNISVQYSKSDYSSLISKAKKFTLRQAED